MKAIVNNLFQLNVYRVSIGSRTWAIPSKVAISGERAQWLGSLMDIAEELRSVLSTYAVDYNYLLLQFQGIQSPPLSSMGNECV